MDENITKILLAILGAVAAVGGITFYFKKKSKEKKYKVTQKNVNINGNNNKVVGGDDKSSK
jgi:LPXTG-motif cell wall-anchored protein